MKVNSDYLIKKLNLQKHPEGGYYSEVYRSEEFIDKDHLPERYTSKHSISTSIYFLLESDDFSAFHKVNSDEIWHFYSGTALTLFIINDRGVLEKIVLGNNPVNGESFIAVIKRGSWFAAKTNDPDSFTLVGCNVAPGFEFDDFELGDRLKLVNIYPQHKELITQLTRI